MKKIITFLSIITLLTLSINSTFANDVNVSVEAEASVEQKAPTRYNVDENRMNEAKEKLNMKKEDLRTLRNNKRDNVKANLDTIKENRKSFRQENKTEIKAVFKDIDESDKIELKELRKNFIEEKVHLKADFKEMEKNNENLSKYREDIAELRKDFYENLKELNSNNSEALELLEKRKNVFEMNQGLRKENIKTRVDFRGERSELVMKYKSAFLERLWNKLERVPSNKLGKISDKIDVLITKTEARSNISIEMREKLLSQLWALKDILDDRMQDNEDEADDLDILEILDLD